MEKEHSRIDDPISSPRTLAVLHAVATYVPDSGKWVR